MFGRKKATTRIPPFKGHPHLSEARAALYEEVFDQGGSYFPISLYESPPLIAALRMFERHANALRLINNLWKQFDRLDVYKYGDHFHIIGVLGPHRYALSQHLYAYTEGKNAEGLTPVMEKLVIQTLRWPQWRSVFRKQLELHISCASLLCSGSLMALGLFRPLDNFDLRPLGWILAALSICVGAGLMLGPYFGHWRKRKRIRSKILPKLEQELQEQIDVEAERKSRRGAVDTTALTMALDDELARVRCPVNLDEQQLTAESHTAGAA